MTVASSLTLRRSLLLVLVVAWLAPFGCPGSSNNTMNDPRPTIVTLLPADGATDVLIDVVPTVTFDLAMDADSVLAAFQLVGVAATITTQDDTTFTLTPDQPLIAGTQYTLRVEASARAANGQELGALVAHQFTTELYPGPPSVTAVDPLHAAAGVLPDTSVTVTFTEPMDAATVEQAFSLTDQASFVIAGNLTTTDDVTFVFTPTQPLAKGMLFTVAVDTVAQDASGSAMALPFSSTFTTADGPEVIDVTPADGAVGVSISPGTVVLSFDRDMDAATLTPATIVLSEVSTGTPIATTVTGFGALSPYRAFVDPSAALVYGTEYEVRVTTACQDTAGRPLLREFTSTFTTRPDPALGPIVLAVTPLDGATDVATSTQITVTFDSAMNEATLTTSSVRLENVATGTQVSAVVQPITVGTTICFLMPQSLLATGTEYRVRVTTACQDQGGLPLVLEHVSTFTTEAVSAPEIVTIIPANGATDVSPLTNIQIAFNREMNPATLNAGTLQLTEATSGNPVPVTITVSTLLGATAATLQPQATLATGMQYQVTVAPSVADTAGNIMGTSFTSTFTTATPTIDPELVGLWGNAASSPSELLSIDVGGNFHHYWVNSYGYTLINFFGTESLIVQTGGALGSTFVRIPGGGTPGSIVGAWIDPLSQSALLIAAGSYVWTHMQSYASGATTQLIETGPLADSGSTLTFKRDAPGLLTQPAGVGSYAITGQRDGYSYSFNVDATSLEFDELTWTRQGTGNGLAGTWLNGTMALTFDNNTAGAYELTDGSTSGTLVDRRLERGNFAAAAGLLTFTAGLGGGYQVDGSGAQDVLRLSETDDPFWEVTFEYNVAQDALTLFGERYTRTAGTPGTMTGTWERTGKEYTFDEAAGTYSRTLNGQSASGAFTINGDRLELTQNSRWIRQ